MARHENYDERARKSFDAFEQMKHYPPRTAYRPTSDGQVYDDGLQLDQDGFPYGEDQDGLVEDEFSVGFYGPDEDLEAEPDNRPQKRGLYLPSAGPTGAYPPQQLDRSTQYRHQVPQQADYEQQDRKSNQQRRHTRPLKTHQPTLYQQSVQQARSSQRRSEASSRNNARRQAQERSTRPHNSVRQRSTNPDISRVSPQYSPERSLERYEQQPPEQVFPQQSTYSIEEIPNPQYEHVDYPNQYYPEDPYDQYPEQRRSVFRSLIQKGADIWTKLTTREQQYFEEYQQPVQQIWVPGQIEQPRVSRRTLLKVGAGVTAAAAVTASGIGIFEWATHRSEQYNLVTIPADAQQQSANQQKLTNPDKYKTLKEKYGPPGKLVYWLHPVSHEQFPSTIGPNGRQIPGTDWRHISSQCFPNSVATVLNNILTGLSSKKDIYFDQVEKMEDILLHPYNYLGSNWPTLHWDLDGLEDASAAGLRRVAAFFKEYIKKYFNEDINLQAEWLSDTWSKNLAQKKDFFNKTIKPIMQSGHMVMVGIEGNHWMPIWAMIDSNGNINYKTGDRVGAVDSSPHDWSVSKNHIGAYLSEEEFVRRWDSTAVVLFAN